MSAGPRTRNSTYDLKYYVSLAKESGSDAGAHILGIKDMAGLCQAGSRRGNSCQSAEARDRHARFTSIPTIPAGSRPRPACWLRWRRGSMPLIWRDGFDESGLTSASRISGSIVEALRHGRTARSLGLIPRNHARAGPTIGRPSADEYLAFESDMRFGERQGCSSTACQAASTQTLSEQARGLWAWKSTLDMT